jgi:pyocin large subunit-like protein
MPLRPIRAERRQSPWARLIVAVLAALSIFLYWSHVTERGQRLAASDVAAPAAEARENDARERDNVGFVDQRRLDEHYAKHGAEFGRITKQDYLHQAQLLRDAEVGGPVLQTVRADGVTTRFDRQTGAFVAFNRNGTIRTFFKPHDGERYYRRQAERSSERGEE